MYKFFTPNDNFNQLITEALSDEDKIHHFEIIQTGWTNITIDVQGQKHNYIFRFPRNYFFAQTMIRDCIFCNFIQGKTSFKTPQMTLKKHAENKPFSVHKKITGKPLTQIMNHLTHHQKKEIAKGIAKFLKELHSIPVKSFPNEIYMTLNDFLTGLASVHEGNYNFKHHHILKKIEETSELCIVHGDFNPGNILIDENHNVAGIIDFAFASVSDPNTDIGRFWGRSDHEFGEIVMSFYEQETSSSCDKQKIMDTIDLFKYVELKYVDYMQKKHPEIILPENVLKITEEVKKLYQE